MSCEFDEEDLEKARLFEELFDELVQSYKEKEPHLSFSELGIQNTVVPDYFFQYHLLNEKPPMLLDVEQLKIETNQLNGKQKFSKQLDWMLRQYKCHETLPDIGTFMETYLSRLDNCAHIQNYLNNDIQMVEYNENFSPYLYYDFYETFIRLYFAFVEKECHKYENMIDLLEFLAKIWLNFLQAFGQMDLDYSNYYEGILETFIDSDNDEFFDTVELGYNLWKSTFFSRHSLINIPLIIRQLIQYEWEGKGEFSNQIPLGLFGLYKYFQIHGDYGFYNIGRVNFESENLTKSEVYGFLRSQGSGIIIELTSQLNLGPYDYPNKLSTPFENYNFCKWHKEEYPQIHRNLFLKIFIEHANQVYNITDEKENKKYLRQRQKYLNAIYCKRYRAKKNQFIKNLKTELQQQKKKNENLSVEINDLLQRMNSLKALIAT